VNAQVATAGKTFTGGNVTGQLGDVGEGAAILAHENLLTRMGQAKAPSRNRRPIRISATI
jgi:hypothetical protein